MTVQRYAAVIQLRPEHEATYRSLHTSVWPDVLAALDRANIRNYSIFLRDGLLFSYYEYSGHDHEADAASLAADEATRSWWQLTEPCQQPLATVEHPQWWAPAEEVFHHDGP
ncbi:MAG: L-rhamnose mutarotase [Jatrophihabitans sp.]|uniref:L-rhamnose mutarotase n=1 Tax=Jatrophihabitans sp. TaxID=1932789 RepID=UPI003F812CBD